MTETLTDTALVPSVDNILAVFDNAFPNWVIEGNEWYDDAHMAARILSDNYVMAAGVIAVLSPLNGWSNNLVQASKAFVKARRHKGLGVSCSKANRILNGENPVDVIGKNSPKVMSFFESIVDPNCDADPVIDRHAFDIAVGRQTSDKERQILSSKKVYASFVKAYREAALLRGITPKKLQAITWLMWREAVAVTNG